MKKNLEAFILRKQLNKGYSQSTATKYIFLITTITFACLVVVIGLTLNSRIPIEAGLLLTFVLAFIIGGIFLFVQIYPVLYLQRKYLDKKLIENRIGELGR